MIEPSWVGGRISVRRVVERHPDGRLLHGDVVGDLLGLDEQTAVIESRQGVVEVPLALVSVARLVAPSTADELALERVVAAGWRPAHRETYDGWTLRADAGFTKRANSVLPLGQLRVPLDDALGAAHAWYAQHGLPLLVQVPVEARRLLDAALGERGWEPSDDVAVLVARLDTRHDAGQGEPSPALALEARPDDAWLSVYRGGSAPAAIARDLLTRHDAVTFASLRIDGRSVAIGRGSVDDGWLGITCVEVDPAHRRQGLAQQLMAGLTMWGRSRGATRAVLEVERGNAAALALYERSGYRHHHDYRYRVEPS